MEQPSWWNQIFVAPEFRIYLGATNDAGARQNVRSDGKRWAGAPRYAVTMINLADMAAHAAALQERDTEVTALTRMTWALNKLGKVQTIDFASHAKWITRHRPAGSGAMTEAHGPRRTFCDGWRGSNVERPG